MKVNKWTEEEIQFLKDNHATLTHRQIGEKIGRTEDAVQLKSRKLGLKKPNYQFNIRFFEYLDSPEKAYWLGFIYADGYVTESKAGYEIGIMLEKSDDNHLKKFNKSLSGNVPVKYRARTNHLKRKSHHKDFTESSVIRLYSKDMFFDLQSQGILTNKTYKSFSMSHIDDNLKWHFIRGFLDGDGHIEKTTEINKYPRVGFTNRGKNILEEMQLFFTEFNINSTIRPVNKDSDVLRLTISDRQSIKNFLNKCYESPIIYLDRKYEIYKNTI